MQLLLYIFTKRKNSTARPNTPGTVVDVRLKLSTSVLSPTFLISGDIEELCMYTYAQWNDRYYFITDISIETNNVVNISCAVDVLATYKMQIGSYTAYIDRSASGGQLDLEDSYVSEKYTIQNTTKTESGDFPNFSQTGCFLLRTCGQTANASSIGVTTYAISAQSIKDVLNFLFDEGNFDFLQDTSVKSFFNPFQYIIDCKWFPFDNLAFGSTYAPIQLGWWTSPVNAVVVTQTYLSGTMIVTLPQGSYTDFRKFSSRFTELYTYMPGCGFYPLNPLHLRADSCAITWAIDVATGESQFRIMSGTFLVGVYSGKFASSVALGQISTDILNIAGGVASGIANLASMQYGTSVSDFTGAIGTLLQPTQSVNGASGSIASLLAYPHVYFYRIEKGSSDSPQSELGRPNRRELQISTLHGYIRCMNASLPLEAYDSERTHVNSYLNGGFYYE